MRGRILKLQYLSCVLLGSLQESVFHLAAESENYLALSIILFLFSFKIHPSPLSLLVLFHSFLPACLLFFTSGIQVFAPRVLLVVLRSARCTFVLLSGPVWAQRGVGGHQPKDQDSSIVQAHSSQWRIWWGAKEGGAMGREDKMGGEQPLSEDLGFVCVTADCLPSSPPPPLRFVPSCPVPWGAAGQAHAPAWNPHPRARRLSPHLQGFTEMPHVPHTLVSTYTLLNGKHRGTCSNGAP